MGLASKIQNKIYSAFLQITEVFMSPMKFEICRCSDYPRGMVSLLNLVAIAALALLSACGSGGSSGSSSSVPDAVVEGVSGELVLLGTTSFSLEEAGYQQSEYFISGKARSFSYEETPQSDGKWTIQVNDEVDYKTRFVVYRPVDAAAFNGTVLVEWLNVSGGIEAAAEWLMMHTELVNQGYAWVGVSAQKAGIDGGGVNLTGFELHLKAVNPDRYNTLVHPGDKYAFDMFSQVAKAIANPRDVDPLEGLAVEKLIAAGESQSADFMVTYVNAIAPVAELFDGYFIHSRFHGTSGLDPQPLAGTPEEDFGSRETVYIRDDLDVPVMIFQTETDLSLLGAVADRQVDSAYIRTWEVPGTAHADLYFTVTGMSDLGDDPDIVAVTEVSAPNPIISCGRPINAGPQHFVAKAAIAALNSWIGTGTAPAQADRMEMTEADSPEFVFDAVGNVLGGIRTPYVDAPVAILSGVGQDSSNTLCRLFGTTELLDSSVLATLYPDHASFVSQVTVSTDNAVQEGFLLPSDGELIKTWAQNSDLGN